MQFWGYKRKEGRAGIRNHVLILPTCACGSGSCRIVASQVRGAVNIVFNTGCSDVAANTAMSQKVLTGFACNPNVYGVVIICLLYTSDAADEEDSVDLGGRRIR